MITIIFAIVAICWCGLAQYFVWRFLLRKKPQSLVIALACCGWPIMVARELRWYPRFLTTPFIALALVGGILGVLIVWHWEMQQQRPFR